MFDWQDYLTLATHLMTQPEPGEATIRTVISRSYYAAYHGAKTKLLEKLSTDFDELSFEKDESHAKVWNAYRGANESIPFSIGRKGHALKVLRKEAYYKSKPTKTIQDANNALQLAQSILKALDTLKTMTTKKA